MKFYWRGTQSLIAEREGSAVTWHQSLDAVRTKAASGVGIVNENGVDTDLPSIMAVLIVEQKPEESDSGFEAERGAGSAVTTKGRAGKRVR